MFMRDSMPVLEYTEGGGLEPSGAISSGLGDKSLPTRVQRICEFLRLYRFNCTCYTCFVSGPDGRGAS